MAGRTSTVGAVEPSGTEDHEAEPEAEAFDAEIEAALAGGPDHDEPRRVDRWRRETATGAITAAFALGMRHVFEPERGDTVAIEQEAPTRPVEGDAVHLRFDPLNSRGTVVVVHREKDE